MTDQLKEIQQQLNRINEKLNDSPELPDDDIMSMVINSIINIAKINVELARAITYLADKVEMELPRFDGVFRAWVSSLCLMQLFVSYRRMVGDLLVD